MSIKCTEVIFTPISPLIVKISGGTSLIVPHVIDKEIVSLEMPNNYDISLGDCLKVKERPYKINIINKIGSLFIKSKSLIIFDDISIISILLYFNSFDISSFFI